MDGTTQHSTLFKAVARLVRIGRDSKHPLPKIAIGLLLVALISLMFPHGEQREMAYTIGAVWVDKDLIAPFSFPIYRDARDYERDRAAATQSVYPVFERAERVAPAVLDSLHSLIGDLASASEARARMLKTRTRADSVGFIAAIADLPFPLTTEEWGALARWRASRTGKSSLASVESFLSSALGEGLRKGVIDKEVARLPQRTIAIRRGATEELLPVVHIADAMGALSEVERKIFDTYADHAEASVAFAIARATLRPNLIYNDVETVRLTQAAEDNVPRTAGFVQENERIVSKHERITDDIKLRLDAYQKAKADREFGTSEWKHWVGIVLHVSLLVSLFGVYLYLFRKRIIGDNSKLALIALLILMETYFAYLTLWIDVTQPIQYLIFVPAASMLLAIIFDSRVAFYGTVAIAFLIAGIRGNDYTIALTSLVAGAFGAYTVRDIRNRTQIFRSLVFIFFGYAVSMVALSFEQIESVSSVFTQLTFALANAVFSPVLTYGLLIFFERAFRVTTDLTLLELSDFNTPLLRELSEKAPGTFHHSMLLGNLAEAAAEATGANPILAKVGAYYHDIGKMNKPEYFVENQIGTHSKHARLRPRMSALIIAAHVKEGVEMARAAGLPERVVEFIPEHHGTTRIAFFFDKAVRQAERKGTGETIQEEDFQYPGPKPRTKETGIVMLADSVEASTRAMSDVTPQELEEAIERMIKQRFSEGQLDDCDLTLKDLTRIKDAFLKILMGIHHQRIAYPKQLVEPEEKPEELPPDADADADEVWPAPAPPAPPAGDPPGAPDEPRA
jgi:putative nucleotidyltransferase with HDIG domain